MKRIGSVLNLFICLLYKFNSDAQSENETIESSNSGWLSLGVRIAVSIFDHDGTGLGTSDQL